MTMAVLAPWFDPMVPPRRRPRRCIKQYKAQWARLKIGRSRCSIDPAAAFSATIVQAVSDMIYVLFSLAWRLVFVKQNHSLTITSYKHRTRPISISKYGIVINVSPGTLDMVHGLTPTKHSPSFWLSRLVRKYRLYFDRGGASARLAMYCLKW